MTPTGSLDQDTATIRAIVAAGRTIPAGTWMVRGPIEYPLGSARVIAAPGAIIIYVEPEPWWGSGFLFCSAGYRQGRTAMTRPRATDLLSVGTGARIIIPDNGCTRPRKGWGVTDTDNFHVEGWRIIGPERPVTPDAKQYGFQVHNSSNGEVQGVFSMMEASGEGADGFHITGTARNVVFRSCATRSGDDASSMTHELVAMQNMVIEDIDWIDCDLNNLAHSAIKILIADGVGAQSAIRRIRYTRCALKTEIGKTGQGAPIYIKRETGIVEDVSIEGGRLEAIVPSNGLVGGPMIYLRQVDDFSLKATRVKHFARTLVDAKGCNRPVIDPGLVSAIGRVPKPRTPRPLVDLIDCPGAKVATAKLVAAYEGQALQ